MARKKEVLDFIRLEKKNFLRKYHLTKIGLFGSYSRDEQQSDSDIDLIVKFEPGTENLYEIKEEIRKICRDQFHSEIDIFREKYIKPYYKERILEDAISTKLSIIGIPENEKNQQIGEMAVAIRA